MKRVPKILGRSSVSNPLDECGSSTSAPRPSSAQCRSTERRSQPESEGAPRTQGASSSSPFANYKRVVDDDKHVSKIKRAPEGSLFYFRSTWHTASGIYNNISQNLEVQMLLENTRLCV